MRTYPKQLSAFREIVNKRGEKLRALTWEQLLASAAESIEHIEVESRQATISVIVQPAGEKLRVVVQGFMKHKLFPGSDVALDGFYKHRNGKVSPIADEEFYAYD
jgi:hypothetical protein